MLRCLAGPSIIALLWFLSRRTIQERTQAEHHTVKRNLWLPHLAQTVLREEADPKHLTYMPQTSKDKGTPALPGATWARKGRRAPLRAHNIVRTHQNHCELNMYLYRKSHPLFGEATNPPAWRLPSQWEAAQSVLNTNLGTSEFQPAGASPPCSSLHTTAACALSTKE